LADNIAGVTLPDFECFKDTESGGSERVLPGLAKGGEAVLNAKAAFVKALQLLVKLAGLQTSFLLLGAWRTPYPRCMPSAHVGVVLGVHQAVGS
jgi:vacuolar-type H+-ATPase subunit D/Vma8